MTTTTMMMMMMRNKSTERENEKITSEISKALLTFFKNSLGEWEKLSKDRIFESQQHTNVVFKVESHTDDDKDDEDEDDEKKEEEEEKEDEDLRSLLVSSMEYNDDTCKEMDG
uniref:Uncharacterized protein n=1 Tax=Vespula pensylvanica TaxID=30213 RepID=A0A834KU80_VESPE|nr:hypothetical protein H0235_012809 [Vespula pensylvanica]